MTGEWVCARCGDADGPFGARRGRLYCEGVCLATIDGLLRDEAKCTADRWPPNGDVCGEPACIVTGREALCPEHLRERHEDELANRLILERKEGR